MGHRISFRSDPTPVWGTVVGVVADVHERGYESAMKPGVYSPITPLDDGWTPDTLVIRTKAEPTALAPAVRRVVASIDPDQPVSELRTIDEIVDLNVADRQQQMTLLGAFAALALILASIGLYGVLSYAVTQRSREIGLRMALGASAASVIRMIVGRGLALTGIGLAIGLVSAWAATRAMKKSSLRSSRDRSANIRIRRRVAGPDRSNRLLRSSRPSLACRPHSSPARRIVGQVPDLPFFPVIP